MISFASYKRFVLLERLVGAGGDNMIHICSSCLRFATVSSSPVIPDDSSLSPSLPWLSRSSPRLISRRVCSRDKRYSRLISLQNCVWLTWGRRRSAVGCPSCVIYSLDDGLCMGRPLFCFIWKSKFLLLYCRKLRLILA